METRYKLFPACRKSAGHRSHQECTGAYIGKFHDPEGEKRVIYSSPNSQYFEVRWQCSCAHHKMTNASVQGDFFKRESAEAPRFEEVTPKQGKLL